MTWSAPTTSHMTRPPAGTSRPGGAAWMRPRWTPLGPPTSKEAAGERASLHRVRAAAVGELPPLRLDRAGGRVLRPLRRAPPERKRAPAARVRGGPLAGCGAPLDRDHAISSPAPSGRPAVPACVDIRGRGGSPVGGAAPLRNGDRG